MPVLDVQAFRTLRKDIKAKTAEAQERAKSKNTTATTKELQGIVHHGNTLTFPCTWPETGGN